MAQPNWENKSKAIAWLSIYRTLLRQPTSPLTEQEAVELANKRTDELYARYPSNLEEAGEPPFENSEPHYEQELSKPVVKKRTAFKGSDGEMRYPKTCNQCGQ